MCDVVLIRWNNLLAQMWWEPNANYYVSLFSDLEKLLECWILWGSICLVRFNRNRFYSVICFVLLKRIEASFIFSNLEVKRGQTKNRCVHDSCLGLFGLKFRIRHYTRTAPLSNNSFMQNFKTTTKYFDYVWNYFLNISKR